jgi:hypothetical protein
MQAVLAHVRCDWLSGTLDPECCVTLLTDLPAPYPVPLLVQPKTEA